jgi:hypothetical protein
VERAIKVERERSERELALAVEKTKREAEVDHQLDDHEEHLKAINGSITRTGTAMIELKETVVEHVDKQEKRNEKWDTEQAVHWRKSGQAFSKRQVMIAYLAILATAGSPVIAALVKSLFGG